MKKKQTRFSTFWLEAPPRWSVNDRVDGVEVDSASRFGEKNPQPIPQSQTSRDVENWRGHDIDTTWNEKYLLGKFSFE